MLSISVVDVDNQPVKGFSVQCYWPGISVGNNPENGASVFTCTLVADIPPNVVQDLKIVVSHPSFFSEETHVHPEGTYWTNPTCMVTPPANPATDPVQVKFVLSRVRLAPTFQFKKAAELAKLKESPNGVLLNETMTPPGPFDYRSLFNGNKDQFLRLKHPILNDPDKDNWKRLNHEPVQVDPSKQGRFRWLEYGTGRQRFAVAIWAPESYFGRGAPNSLDFIVFYSPTTAKKPEYKLYEGQSYPYGLHDKNKGPWQRYIAGLGQAYLFDGHFLVYEMLAAKKRAILVMPINNIGDWGPFSSGAGVHQLLKEIAHFVHKQRLAHVNSSNGFIRATYPSIPTIGRVVISGFSSGLEPINKLLASSQGATGGDSQFQKVWKEIWDLDLKLGTHIPTFEELLMKWLGMDPARRFRMYHSEYTAKRRRPSSGKTLASQGTGIHKKGATPDVEAEELHAADGRWSAVYFSNLFLQRNEVDTNPDGPWFPGFVLTEEGEPDHGNKHHFTLMIAFGHAALMSTLDSL